MLLVGMFRDKTKPNQSKDQNQYFQLATQNWSLQFWGVNYQQALENFPRNRP